MPNVLKKITARAKQIYKAHPSRAWISCIKQASQELKKGSKKISGVKKKKSAPRRRRKAGSKIRRKKIGLAAVMGSIRTNRDAVDRKRVNVTIGSVSHHKSQAKKGIREQIANKAGRRELVIKVRERKKLTREIAKLKKDYRALC
jgi:RNase P/RNase MRP subunit p30